MDKQQNPGLHPNDPRINRDHAVKMMNQQQNSGFAPNDPRMRDHALLNQPHGNPAHLFTNDFRSEQLLKVCIEEICEGVFSIWFNSLEFLSTKNMITTAITTAIETADTTNLLETF